MSVLPIYLSALGYGFAGGFAHCIGMCGIFVVSYTGLPDTSSRRRLFYPERHLLFHTGRLCSLATLGLLGGAVGQLTHLWATAQSWISLLAGALMLGLALGFVGVLPRFKLPEPDVLGAGGGHLRRVFLRVLQSRSAWKPLLIGLFVGLLPCGLTGYALIPTLTLGPLQGALLMTLFGLGTVPGLLALGLAGNAVGGGLLTRASFRARMTQVSAVIMAVVGIAFLWRGMTSL